MTDIETRARAVEFILEIMNTVVLSGDTGSYEDNLDNVLTGATQIYNFLIAGTTK
jgi:ethanolamine utilization microcompartment shell protein EutS